MSRDSVTVKVHSADGPFDSVEAAIGAEHARANLPVEVSITRFDALGGRQAQRLYLTLAEAAQLCNALARAPIGRQSRGYQPDNAGGE